jgi:hypothetical protein
MVNLRDMALPDLKQEDTGKARKSINTMLEVLGRGIKPGKGRPA